MPRKTTNGRWQDDGLAISFRACRLVALDALGVHRVVFTTGDAAAEAGRIGCEVRTVRELLRDEDGHVSRGDACENERKGLTRGTRCAPCE